jgi:hypothetical protein
MRSLLPMLGQSQRELEADLRHWIETRPDGDVRFTAHSYRNALSQIDVTARAVAMRLQGVTVGAAERAQILALTHLTDEVARYSNLFEGSTRRLSLNVAAQLATGRSFIVPRIETSAARYAGMVREDLRTRLSVSILRGEQLSRVVDRLQAHGGPRGMVALAGIAGTPNAVVEYIPEGLFARYRHWAERVVRTETQAAYNGQLLEGMHEASVEIPDLKKRWNADGGACDEICLPMDGQVVGLHESFSSARGPVDFAPAHPNCRCRSGPWRDAWNYPRPMLDPNGPSPPSTPPSPPAPPAAPPAPPAPPAPVPPPAPASGPRGTPVSHAVHLPNSPLGKQLQRSLDAIDRVHGDGVLPVVPVNTNGTMEHLGVFKPRLNYVTGQRSGRIQIHPTGSHPELTAIHEIGHMLDFMALPNPQHGAWPTHMAPALAAWRSAVDRSNAIAQLRAMKPGKYRNYLLRREEIWARSYAQYIAVRSQDPVLLAQVARMRVPGTGVYYPRQWDDAEFEPIAAEFDRLLKALGWIQ